MLAQQTPNWG